MNFTKRPRVALNEEIGELRVQDCTFESSASGFTGYAYYRLNSTIKIDVRVRGLRNRYFFNWHVITYDQPGTFECVVFDPNRMHIEVKSAVSNPTSFIGK